MRIIVSTDNGEVRDIIPSDEIGDLSKPLAAAELVHRLSDALRDAASLEETPR